MHATIPTTNPPAADCAEELALTERERKFLKRMTAKYVHSKRKPLLQSVIVFSVMVLAGHLIERAPLPWWAALILVYVPALIVFSRYRKFGIFKSQLMCKLALRDQAVPERRACS